MNENEIPSNGHSIFEVSNIVSNWIEDFNYDAIFQLNFSNDDHNYTDGRNIGANTYIDYMLQEVGVQFNASRTIALKKNQLKVGLGINPFTILSPQRNLEKYRQSPLNLRFRDRIILDSGHWLKNYELLNYELESKERRLQRISCQLILSAGLVLNRRVHFMFEYRPALLSYSSEKLYLHSFGINAQYQL